MAVLTFDLTDDRTGLIVNVTVTEKTDGTLSFDLQVVDDTGVIGDLNGLFFDMLDDSMVDGLIVTGDDVSKVVLNADSVTKIDSYNNINGEVKADYGKFDAGVQFGTSGMATDDIQFTTFTLSHKDENIDLTLDQFFSQDFAVRLTSVGTEDGSRDDSLKIGGTAGDTPVVEESVNVATDNTLLVSNRETFDGRDELDDVASILSDDTTDEFQYEGLVIAAGDKELAKTDAVDFVEVAGSMGGLLRVYEDGTVDFSAAGDFDGLDQGDDLVFTEFTYTIEGGSTATIQAQVFGDTDESIDDGGYNEEPYYEGGYVEESFSDFG